MKKIIYILLFLFVTCATYAQIPDPCTGAGAAQAISTSSPCNCSETNIVSGTPCNKSVFGSQALADASIHSFLTTQNNWALPTTPVAWQDVRSQSLSLNGAVKHEFCTEITTSATTNFLYIVNIAQVQINCSAVCQDYKFIPKGNLCGTNAITPVLVASTLDPTVFYRRYAVAPNTTYIACRQLYFDGTDIDCYSTWLGGDGVSSLGAQITAQHWFIWSDGSLLPLRNINVSASQFNTSIKVQWQTLGENNVARFEIEKSADGNIFLKINDVLAKGNTTSQTSYWVEDKTPAPINFYRIKTIDVNGKMSISTTLTYDLQNNVQSTIIVSPNPVANIADIFFESKINCTGYYAILNTMGNTVIKEKIAVQKGINKVSQNVSGMAAGTYLFLLNTNEEKLSVKFIKE